MYISIDNKYKVTWVFQGENKQDKTMNKWCVSNILKKKLFFNILSNINIILCRIQNIYKS